MNEVGFNNNFPAALYQRLCQKFPTTKGRQQRADTLLRFLKQERTLVFSRSKNHKIGFNHREPDCLRKTFLVGAIV